MNSLKLLHMSSTPKNVVEVPDGSWQGIDDNIREAWIWMLDHMLENDKTTVTDYHFAKLTIPRCTGVEKNACIFMWRSAIAKAPGGRTDGRTVWN